jgi:hypothetical protein
MYLYNSILHLSQNLFRSFLPLKFFKIFYTFRRLYVQTLYVWYFYTFRRYTLSNYTLRFICSDVIRSDVIRSVFIRSDVIRSDVIRSVIIRSVGESVYYALDLQYVPSLCISSSTLLVHYKPTLFMGSARHLYVVCIYGVICLQIQIYFPLDPAIFSPRSKTLILLYVVSKHKQKKFNISWQNSKRLCLKKYKFVDISHHRYKLRRDIE